MASAFCDSVDLIFFLLFMNTCCLAVATTAFPAIVATALTTTILGLRRVACRALIAARPGTLAEEAQSEPA